MGKPSGITEAEGRLIRVVSDILEGVAAQRADRHNSGEYSIKLVHRQGRLTAVHMDDHLILTPSDFARNAHPSESG